MPHYHIVEATKAVRPVLGRYFVEPERSGPIPFHLVKRFFKGAKVSELTISQDFVTFALGFSFTSGADFKPLELDAESIIPSASYRSFPLHTIDHPPCLRSAYTSKTKAILFTTNLTTPSSSDGTRLRVTVLCLVTYLPISLSGCAKPFASGWGCFLCRVAIRFR